MSDLNLRQAMDRRLNEFLLLSRRAANRRWWRSVLAWAVWILLGFTIAWAVLWAWGQRTTAAVAARYAWVQMLPDKDGETRGRLVRAIVTEGSRCPSVLMNSVDKRMDPRPASVSAAFPILLCEVQIDAESEAWLGSRRLPVRPAEPQEILVIGDTGCRLVNWERQACHSGLEWPFSAVAVSAARALRPAKARSIIIHVGDFHYREHPCEDSSEDCGASPYGENWATWEEEFFRPASPLLLSAPWIIMRGNHETCTRAGAGWLFFFALPDQNYEGACVDRIPPYALTIGRSADGRPHVLQIFDTANSEDSFGYGERCGDYHRWANAMDESADIWLAVHKPLWYRAPKDKWPSKAVPRDPCREPDKPPSALDAVRRLLESPIPGNPPVSVVLSGDLHVFQIFDPREQNLPVQIVAGNGGTALDKIVPFPELAKPHPYGEGLPEDTAIEALKVHGIEGDALTIKKHGFVLLRREADNWSLALHGADGRLIASCAALPTQTPLNSGLSGCNIESATRRRD